MIVHAQKETILHFAVMAPLYTPFYNVWGANAYYRYDAFDLDPFTLRAASTSGSPVVLAGNAFFGFLNQCGGRFAYDGIGTLTVTCPPGQTLYYEENCDPYRVWRDYNEQVLSDFPEKSREDFWSNLEYCTWVDQNRAGELAGGTCWSCLNEEYVYQYMDRVEQMGLPKGKLTIDDGWDIRYAPDGRMVYGDWKIDREKFPHMEKLVSDMKDRGFIPGLWFAPFTATPNSKIAMKYPDLLGDTFSQNAENESVRRLMFLKPDARLEEYYKAVFAPYIRMGFLKFKLDMSYGNKKEMIELLKMMYRIIKEMNPAIEVEAHIPDIFATRYCDTLRINDVAFDPQGKWRGVTHEYYKVCRFSSPDTLLNLDHLGTNTPQPAWEDFYAHTQLLLRLEGGYPCVSLLPDCFNQEQKQTFVDSIYQWEASRK